jgi:RNA polymerase sigma-70 factor (TIGR02943 family)
VSPKPEEWLDKYGDYLYSLAYLKVRNRQTAEDLVQDTLLAAYRSAGTFRGTSSEKTWLTAILNNKIVDFFRRKDVLRNISHYLDETEQSFHRSFFETSAERYGHWIKEQYPKQWEPVAEEDDDGLQSVLHTCISHLPEKLLAVFTARYIDEEKSETICKDHGITSSNYWVILHRAKVLLRSCLETNWFSK